MNSSNKVPYVNLPSGVSISVRGMPYHISRNDMSYPDILSMLRDNVTEDVLLNAYDFEKKCLKHIVTETIPEEEFSVYNVIGLYETDTPMEDGELIESYDDLRLAKHDAIENTDDYKKIIITNQKNQIVFHINI